VGLAVGVEDAAAVQPERATARGASHAPHLGPEAGALPQTDVRAKGGDLVNVLGTSARARFGSALIGAGAIAILYAVLTQLRPG